MKSNQGHLKKNRSLLCSSFRIPFPVDLDVTHVNLSDSFTLSAVKLRPRTIMALLLHPKTFMPDFSSFCLSIIILGRLPSIHILNQSDTFWDHGSAGAYPINCWVKAGYTIGWPWGGLVDLWLEYYRSGSVRWWLGGHQCLVAELPS